MLNTFYTDYLAKKVMCTSGDIEELAQRQMRKILSTKTSPCRTWEPPSDLNGQDKSFHSARKPERARWVPTHLSSVWSPSVISHKRWASARGGPARELSCHRLLLRRAFTGTQKSAHGLMQSCVWVIGMHKASLRVKSTGCSSERSIGEFKCECLLLDLHDLR